MYRRRGKGMGAKNEKNELRARQMAIAPTHYHSVRAGICCSKGFFFSWVGGEVQNEMHILLKGQPIFFHLFYAPFEENQDHQMGRCQDTATSPPRHLPPPTSIRLFKFNLALKVFSQ